MVDKYNGKNISQMKQTCISLLTSSLLTNGISTLGDLEVTPMVLVSGILRSYLMDVNSHLRYWEL